MLTYSGSRNLYGILTSNIQSINLTTGDTLMANATRDLLAERNWDFLEQTFSIPSVSQQQFYNNLSNMDTIKSVISKIGTTQYYPKEVPSWGFWQSLNESTSYYSDISEWWVQFNGQIGIWPTPSSTAAAFTVTGEQKVIDLGVADYVTGTISGIVSNGTVVTGSGTTWSTAMAGRWIQIAKASGGDGMWYQIKSVSAPTGLTLVGGYNGLPIIAGSATYTIGEASLIPEAYQMIPVLDAVMYYFQFIQPDENRASEAAGKRTNLYNKMVNKYGKKSTSPVIDYGQTNSMSNPNLTISNVG